MDNIVDKLRDWRENCRRDPEALRQLWPKLDWIEKQLSFEERWTVIEQFCMAGIDLHDEEIIDTCLKRLRKQFPGSNRVKLLSLMAKYERVGNYDAALKCYDEMIDEDETNTSARKRKIAILISQRKYVEAIRDLCDYLRRFMNDQEAWKELCELYMLEQDYHKAVFCMEELLLNNPLDHIYHTRLAELHYTIGSQESIELARSYYSQALKLNDKNIRALFGLHLTLTYIINTNQKLNANTRKEYEKQLSGIKTTLANLYDGGLLRYMLC